MTGGIGGYNVMLRIGEDLEKALERFGEFGAAGRECGQRQLLRSCLGHR